MKDQLFDNIHRDRCFHELYVDIFLCIMEYMISPHSKKENLCISFFWLNGSDYRAHEHFF